MLPELATIMLYAEALEDNEVILIENLRQFNRIMLDSNKKIFLEQLDVPKMVRFSIFRIFVFQIICI